MDPAGRCLERAFHLAYFLHPKRAVALDVVTRALFRLPIEAARQDRRRYQPPARHRTEVALSKPQLLQRLVCWMPVERRFDPEDFFIQLIVYLIWVGPPLNSFSINIGLGRILHNYSTAECRRIYEFLIQDPERLRSDDQYRRSKRLLLKLVLKRFDPLLRICRGHRGETRLRSRRPSARQRDLARRCFELLTPWETGCRLPEAFDPMTEEVSAFCFRGDHPDEEHPFKARRIHALLHPECYERLTAALGLEAPENRLRIPELDLDGVVSPACSSRRAEALREDEKARIEEKLDAMTQRRRRWISGFPGDGDL